MTQAFPGISNENSFFSDHYLTTQFAGDRRDWERRVNLDNGDTPAGVSCNACFTEVVTRMPVSGWKSRCLKPRGNSRLLS